jgi:hypothetical protein
MKKMLRKTVVGISFPQQLVERIDKDRGDIPRSRFLVRILERAYDQKEIVRR